MQCIVVSRKQVSPKLVAFILTWSWRQQTAPKRWFLLTKLHGVTPQQTAVLTPVTTKLNISVQRQIQSSECLVYNLTCEGPRISRLGLVTEEFRSGLLLQFSPQSVSHLLLQSTPFASISVTLLQDKEDVSTWSLWKEDTGCQVSRQWIGPFKPSGHFTYRQFNIQKLYVLPTHCICAFLRIWDQTAIVSLYSFNWLVFITET
jgi:hypothetical protein